MSKSNKQRKAEQRAQQQARKVTVGKMLRLLLKSVAFAILVSLLVIVLTILGMPGLDNVWIQMALVFGAYLLAYPILMSEFRVKRSRGGRDQA